MAAYFCIASFTSLPACKIKTGMHILLWEPGINFSSCYCKNLSHSPCSLTLSWIASSLWPCMHGVLLPWLWVCVTNTLLLISTSLCPVSYWVIPMTLAEKCPLHQQMEEKMIKTRIPCPFLSKNSSTLISTSLVGGVIALHYIVATSEVSISEYVLSEHPFQLISYRKQYKLPKQI